MATEISENLPEIISENLPEIISENLPEIISENLPEIISENLPEISENLPEIFFHKVEDCCCRAESKFRTSKNYGGFDTPYCLCMLCRAAGYHSSA